MLKRFMFFPDLKSSARWLFLPVFIFGASFSRADEPAATGLTFYEHVIPVNSQLRTSGLYAFREGNYTHYLRFYHDGTVISALTSASASDVANWLIPLSQYGAAKLNILGTTIRFTVGNTDYVGTIARDVLNIDSYTHINGHESKADTKEYAFLMIDPKLLPDMRTTPHEFSFGDEGENADITFTDYQYGPLKFTFGVQKLDTLVDMPVPALLKVQWRQNSTAAIYEDTVDLQSLLPQDITGQIVHFAIWNSQLYVYLISHQLHEVTTPDCPVWRYKAYKCTTLYQGQHPSLLNPGTTAFSPVTNERVIFAPPRRTIIVSRPSQPNVVILNNSNNNVIR